MKRIFFLCAVIYFILNMPLFSQNKILFHYPLNNGDFWEYEEHGFSALKFWVTREVIGDSTLPNGKTYKTIKQIHQRDGVHLLFQRIENNEVYQYAPKFVQPDSVLPHELLYSKLDLKVGDTWLLPEFQNSTLSDSGFYRVEEIADTSFAHGQWRYFVLGIYNLPDSSLHTSSDIIFLDSLGVFFDGFEGGYYRLRGAIINGRQFGIITSVNEPPGPSNIVPESIALFTTYPNPVISGANIRFDLNRPSAIDISIFDLLGRQVYEFTHKSYGVGSHLLHWKAIEQLTGRSVPNGVYFIKLVTNSNFYFTRKLVVLK